MPACRGYVSALTDAAKVVTEQAAQIARRRIFTNFLDGDAVVDQKSSSASSSSVSARIRALRDALGIARI